MGAKQRFSDDRVVISSVIGDVTGKDVIILDDEIAKGSTVIELLDRLREQRVRSVRIACTHGLFAAWGDRAAERAARGRGDRLHQHRAAATQGRRQAHRPVDRARPGRGHAPDPRRRVGERPVQYILSRCPVTRRPWWEARNVITSATSSGWAMSRSTLEAATAFSTSSLIQPVSVTGG